MVVVAHPAALANPSLQADVKKKKHGYQWTNMGILPQTAELETLIVKGFVSIL